LETLDSSVTEGPRAFDTIGAIFTDCAIGGPQRMRQDQ